MHKKFLRKRNISPVMLRKYREGGRAGVKYSWGAIFENTLVCTFGYVNFPLVIWCAIETVVDKE